MMLSHSLRALADDPQFVSSLVGLAEGMGLSPDEHAGLAEYAKRKQWALIGLAEALDDAASEEDLYRCLASAWLEHRFEWQRYNMVLNYQAVRNGAANTLMLVTAAVCSNLLDRIEGLLDADDRDRWASFAVELIAGANADLSSRWGDEAISLSPLS